MNSHYTYFIILAASLAGPLALSFDKKVAFYKQCKYLLPAMLVPALVYIVWDIYFTSEGIWSFNDKYIVGIKLYNLPIEEILFFFVIPYCAVFVYECIKCYFPSVQNKRGGDKFFLAIALLLFVTGISHFEQRYTSFTFLLSAFTIFIIMALKRLFKTFSPSLFLISYVVVLIPFLVVNGFLTALPVVIYNNKENLNFRIGTIPFEDVFYGMVLILLTILFFEKLRTKTKG